MVLHTPEFVDALEESRDDLELNDLLEKLSEGSLSESKLRCLNFYNIRSSAGMGSTAGGQSKYVKFSDCQVTFLVPGRKTSSSIYAALEQMPEEDWRCEEGLAYNEEDHVLLTCKVQC